MSLQTESSRRRVVVLGTGGTIASTGSNALDHHEYSVTESVGDVVAAVPEICEIAEVHSVQVTNIDSFEIDNSALLSIARAASTVLQRADVDGLVVTHGTDTLEETAYFLHLTLRSSKPIVVVGAMRPSTSFSPDGPMSLYNAVLTATAANAGGKGVLVVANNHVYGARHVAKRDTFSIGAIDGAKHGILGEISGKFVEFTQSPLKLHTESSEFDLAKIARLPQVDIIFDHQSARIHMYDASIASGTRAIIVAGMGNGSLSPGARAGAALAHRAGVAFVRASRTGQGIVAPLASDHDLGITPAGSLTPTKARILAMTALAFSVSTPNLRSVFDRY